MRADIIYQPVQYVRVGKEWAPGVQCRICVLASEKDNGYALIVHGLGRTQSQSLRKAMAVLRGSVKAAEKKIRKQSGKKFV